MNRRLDFYDLTRLELEDWFESRGMPRYRARQIFLNVYQRGVTDFAAMTDLPLALRAELARALDLKGPTARREVRSTEDDSRKVLWTLADGKEIESVIMTAEYGDTVCFSTQVGCAFMCSFCITAKMGRLRNLTAGEIVAQIVAADRLRPRRKAGANLVAMGMGEPLDNLDALLKAISILQDDLGMNISGRRITVSTVGVVPGIDRLARENPSVGLALSLNATTDEVRKTIMPVARKWSIEALMAALERYAAASDRRVTLEYVLIRDVNDSPQDAERLGNLAQRFPSKVNVIPFNPSDLFPYRRPSPEAVDAFARKLWPFRTTVTVRYSKGLDILAACGQLGYQQVKDRFAAGT